MIISKTPFRMSFFGGGSDMPEFFNEFGGSVISSTFDKYCYVTIRHLPPFFDYYTEVSYSKIERVKTADELEHPLVRNAMKYKDIRDVRITYEADLPARSGLGTSSSFAVGLLNTFYRLKGKTADKRKLAEDAIYVERTLCKEAGGWQDQIAASYGGFNRIDFKDNDFTVRPIKISDERKNRLNDNLLMFFTGFTRLSSEVIKDSKSIDEKKDQLRQMSAMVDEAEAVLSEESRDLDDFGRLLDKTWKLKKQTGNHVSTGYIDRYYDAAMKAGALGGKLLGAGGGGFLLFYVQPDKQDAVKDAMKELLHIPFRFESEGSTVIYETEESYSFRE